MNCSKKVSSVNTIKVQFSIDCLILSSMLFVHVVYKSKYAYVLFLLVLYFIYSVNYHIYNIHVKTYYQLTLKTSFLNCIYSMPFISTIQQHSTAKYICRQFQLVLQIFSMITDLFVVLIRHNCTLLSFNYYSDHPLCHIVDYNGSSVV